MIKQAIERAAAAALVMTAIAAVPVAALEEPLVAGGRPVGAESARLADKPHQDGKHKIKVGDKGDRKPLYETDPVVRAAIAEGASKFTQDMFVDTKTGVALEYSLYVPEGYDGHTAYPLLMYIPDASGASKTAKEIVEQYYGADIWVTAEEQEKHPAFVVVPAFSEIVVDDDWNTSPEIEAAVAMLEHLTKKYAIDARRIYTTGQSMGCMTSLYLNSTHPNLFAASLFVAGQWDVSVLKPLEQAKFFYIAAAGDIGGAGGQDAVMHLFDGDGVPYGYGCWSAQDDVMAQNAAAEAITAQGHDANFIRFERGSVLNGSEGMEHAASFVYGYKIPAVRDWLFSQTK